MREIKVRVQERKTKEGRAFKVYKAVTKNGRLIDCKFRRDCNMIPEADCKIIVNDGACNMQRNTEFPVLWVSEIVEIRPLSGADNAAANAAELADMFG